jgi:regulator of cell morphogenesis and NO signaling
LPQEKGSPVNVTDPGATLGQLVIDRPAAASLFEQLGLDYCCGGRRTLEEACVQRGLDAKTVTVLLDALRHEPIPHELDHHDVAHSSISALCEHIVARHHEPLRADLPRIDNLLATVVRVHGKNRPELADVQRLFSGMRGELEIHMRLEEHKLFPACRALEEHGDASGFDADVIALLEDDHDATGDSLSALRELCGGYDSGWALCATHRKLLQSLGQLELELHQHVHEENNVLFPRVRAQAQAA